MKKIWICFLAIACLFVGCRAATPSPTDNTANAETQIWLSDQKITVNGTTVSEQAIDGVYCAKDIVFYLADQGFTYGEGEPNDEHTQAEADAHTVLHITKPGRYAVSGKLSLGQIAVDLGENAKTDPNGVVTLVLNGVDITCKVAPAVIFYNVYECCNKDETTATKEVDTAAAGANVVIADHTENNVHGAYVAEIYQSYQCNEQGTQVVESEKLHKYDGAFYSRQSMNIYGGEQGNGVLNIVAENEGLDSERHLTIHGGVINITSGNDGINTNEDNISVTTVNGGTLTILCNGSTGEGDGIDSNGWLVINGGKITAQACATSGDAGIDSDKGIYINGGRVVASGNMLDSIAGGEQIYAVFQFAERQKSGTYSLKDSNQKIIGEYTIENDFTYLIVAGDELGVGDYTFYQGETQLGGVAAKGMQGEKPGEKPDSFQNGGNPPAMTPSEPPQPPQGEQPPQPPQGEQPPQPPQGEQPPQPPQGEQPPQPPQGEQPPQPPQGEQPPQFAMPSDQPTHQPTEEPSEIFAFKEESNYFVQVAPIEK